MSTNAGVGKLRQAAKDLRTVWEETRTVWHDDNSRHFEEKIIVPLLAHVRQVEQALMHMGAVLQDMRRDCE